MTCECWLTCQRRGCFWSIANKQYILLKISTCIAFWQQVEIFLQVNVSAKASRDIVCLRTVYNIIFKYEREIYGKCIWLCACQQPGSE